MVNFDIAELRSKIDTEKLFVDFGILRAALSVVKVVRDLDVTLSEPSREGECRGRCPKCQKEKSFSLNINTNRFNCFAKGCTLKGGGVIDFCAKLYEVSAKEASHLVACAYGIQPYNQAVAASESLSGTESVNEKMPAQSREVTEDFSDPSEDTRQTAAYLIASIKHDLTQLEQLLIPR
jgi:hypothetical protein